MPAFSTAFAGLLTAAGATALTVRGIHRLVSRRTDSTAPGGPPPQPRPMPDPDAAPLRGMAPPPDRACSCCGAVIPAADTICAICARQAGGDAQGSWTTVLHWVVFLLGTAAIIAAGALFGS